MTKTPYKTPNQASKWPKTRGTMYQHVMHDPKWPAQVWARNEVEFTVSYFEGVISKWLKSLRYSIPLTKILWPQTLIIILWFWPPSDHLVTIMWPPCDHLMPSPPPSPWPYIVVRITKLGSVFEAKVSWSTVYYASDFPAIWIWHLQNTKMS